METPEHPALRGFDLLERGESFAARRSGRFIVVDLLEPHRVISTSDCQGGQREDLRHLANHQSCEGKGHASRMERLSRMGRVAYHSEVCAEIGVEPERTAVMGTAANMAYACHRKGVFDDARVDALVTAGVAGNAARAGDPAGWHETEDGWRKIPPPCGTINIILLLGLPVTAAALARAVVTMTEAKSAALAELAVPSLYSPTIATGTGTDQFCVAAPLDPKRRPREYTGPHTKLGEIIGTSVREAVREALRWQNGLDPSRTRGVFHAMGRFGLGRGRAMEFLEKSLTGRQFALLEANERSVFHEPGVGAAAHAMAAVLDRIAFGSLPPGQAGEALRQQAACIACALAARPKAWGDLYRQLGGERPEDPVDLALRAIALGWAAKWT